MRALFKTASIVALTCAFIMSVPADAFASCKQITFSTHANLPPVSWKQDNKIYGIGPDLIRTIGQQMNIPVTFVHKGPWKRVLQSLKNGEIDLIPALYWKHERTHSFQYTNPYYKDSIAIFTSIKKPFKFTDLSDLKGKVGVGSTGESYGDFFDNYSEKNLNIKRVTSIVQVLKMVRENRVDYGVSSHTAALDHIEKLGFDKDIFIRDKFVGSENMLMAFSRKSPCAHLFKEINSKLAEMYISNEIHSVINKNIYLMKSYRYALNQ